ncbi:uncharacterized protein BDV17DRAFT_261104 [Aspergillus undulatus]|uniref:uncharacterized protein n=1 Tax=Aspergillus undulatus TaxID=1810928 RepID=UPI003CCD21A7
MIGPRSFLWKKLPRANFFQDGSLSCLLNSIHDRATLLVCHNGWLTWILLCYIGSISSFCPRAVRSWPVARQCRVIKAGMKGPDRLSIEQQ